jgi:DNA-binding HxlR family transcriptional regulator
VHKNAASGALVAAIRLFHRRWSVPVIATLYRDGPARFTDLVQRLPRASRDTLAETLNELQAAGAIAREGPDTRYRLTAAGDRLGEAALEAVATAGTPDLVRVALKKWPMLALVAVGRGCGRFNEVKAALPGVTSGALAPALKDLEAVGLVAREVQEGYPPSVLYVLTPDGARVFPVMDEIARAADAGFRATAGSGR